MLPQGIPIYSCRNKGQRPEETINGENTSDREIKFIFELTGYLQTTGHIKI